MCVWQNLTSQSRERAKGGGKKPRKQRKKTPSLREKKKKKRTLTGIQTPDLPYSRLVA